MNESATPGAATEEGPAAEAEPTAEEMADIVEIPPGEADDRFGLGTAEREEAERRGDAAPRITNDDILDKLQKRLYEAIDEMEPDKALRLYEAMVKREEVRVRLAAKGKPDPGTAELRRKAARAFRGGQGTVDDDDGDGS